MALYNRSLTGFLRKRDPEKLLSILGIGMKGTYLSNLYVERPFDTTFRAEVDTRCVRSAFKYFSAKGASAMNAHMDMNEWGFGILWIDGHSFNSLRLDRGENGYALNCENHAASGSARFQIGMSLRHLG